MTPGNSPLTTQESVRVEVERMPDGLWFATLHIGGLQKAGSGRRSTPEEALQWLPLDIYLGSDDDE